MNILIIIGNVIFLIGVLGIYFNRKNIILMLMSIELILLGINLILITYSLILNDIVGEILSLYLLTASAGELAIGLALVINSYRIKGTISIKSINLIKG